MSSGKFWERMDLEERLTTLFPSSVSMHFFFLTFCHEKKLYPLQLKKKEIIDQTDLEEVWEHGLDL